MATKIKRKNKVPESWIKKLKSHNKILITAGLGDFVVLDAFMTNEEKRNVNEIYFASRARYAIETLIDAAPIFPNLQKKVIIWDEWGNTSDPDKIFAIVSKEQLASYNNSHNWGLDLNILNDVVDRSIYCVFPEILKGDRKLNQSSLLKLKLANIEKFNLPENYGIINPYSPSDRQNGKRDFTQAEWMVALQYLEKNKQYAAVINCSDDYIPNHELLINLNYLTTPPEAVEVCKKGKFYIGLDSWIPALMTKFLEEKNLFIKTNNEHYIRYLPIYCAPYTNFYFVYQSIEVH
jgi:hypothetical protein